MSAPAASCRSCPLCQGLATLREADPDAVRRVELASAGLVAAVRDLFAAAAGPGSGQGKGPGNGPAEQAWHPPAGPTAPSWQPIEIGD